MVEDEYKKAIFIQIAHAFSQVAAHASARARAQAQEAAKEEEQAAAQA